MNTMTKTLPEVKNHALRMKLYNCTKKFTSIPRDHIKIVDVLENGVTVSVGILKDIKRTPEQQKVWEDILIDFNENRNFYITHRDIPNEVVAITDIAEFYKMLKKYEIYSFSQTPRKADGMAIFMAHQTFSKFTIKKWSEPNPDWIEFRNETSSMNICSKIVKVEKEIRGYPANTDDRFTVYFEGTDETLEFTAMSPTKM